MNDIISELRRYEATLVHKCGENPYMVMASADDGDYCEYQQAIAEISRLRQLLSEAEKREREARAKALEDAAKACVSEDKHGPWQNTNAGFHFARIVRTLQSEER